jgi:anti-anti-sigma regulatory factor
MAIEYRKNLAVFRGVVSVEEAEGLLEWLQKKRSAKVDLSACTHFHAANLQVLMAARAKISAWPDDVRFAAWLRTALAER